MPETDNLEQLMQNAKEKAAKNEQSVFSPAKLEKAKLYRVKADMKMSDPLAVQFNPSEYQITRTTTLSKKTPIGRDPDISTLQAASGNFATLSLTLYFDTISDLEDSHSPSSTKGVAANNTQATPAQVCVEIATLLRYDEEELAPARIRFVWGKLDFMGYVTNSTVKYTMFAQDGTPVRAKLDLSVSGEETAIFQKSMQRAAASSDHTKERVLVEGESLPLMAQREYDDPAKWKEIARENGILNPRQVESAAVLKLPPIK